ncbi:MAG TPA: hypothetical protein VNB64_12165 [Solirubrobacteraceae bacterium]|nr:hypothetical protein [Solirubrobacteraceae bacterium]
MGTPSDELGAIVGRLEAAAARLKEDAAPVPDRERPEELRRDRREATSPPAERRRLGEVLDGLERANVEVRRARARLAELEARLAVRDAA